MYTIVAGILFLLTIVALVVRLNWIRTLVITLASLFVVLLMIFGYSASLRGAANGVDIHGEEIAKHMLEGMRGFIY